MPKHYRVTPHLSGGTSYAALFRNASGKRVHRSLGTEDESLAKLVCLGLERLYREHVTDPRSVPPDVPLEAVRLYLGVDDETIPAADVMRDMDSAAAVATRSDGTREHVADAWVEARRWQQAFDGAKVQIAGLQQMLAAERKARADLERSMLARAALAGKNCPVIPEALVEFEANVAGSMTPRNARDHMTAARRFVASLPADVRKLADVMPSHVSSFLDGQASNGAAHHAAARRRHWRLKLSRLLNWAAKRWEFPSPMSGVATVSRSALMRERGDVHWHSLEEVQEAMDGVGERLVARFAGAHRKNPVMADPDDLVGLVAYWQALIATLAYAGLQLAELVWLRRSDLKLSEDGQSGSLWVTTVADPEDSGMKHLLKTEHRRREVNLHPRLLLPRLTAHLAKRAGAHYLFPVPDGYRARIRAKSSGGSAERWLLQSLSVALRGHQGGTDLAKRPPTPGILPAGMNAKSLRRTFGSLLLRSGKSYAQVAAAMGNTEKVVHDHYARMRGCEVNVDF
jgi:integrase